MKKICLTPAILFLLASWGHAQKLSIPPFRCELPFCEPDTGAGISSALSTALKLRGYTIVERWGGPDFILQGEIKDFDPSEPDALISLEVRIVDAKAGRLVKILNADGHPGEGSGEFHFPGELLKWKNRPMGEAIASVIGKMVQKIEETTGKPFQPQIQPPALIPPPDIRSERIKGGSLFVPGEKTIFFVDFSKYQIGDVPREFRIEGQVEIAEFQGKKWIRALSKYGKIVKIIDLPEEWSLEIRYFWDLKEFWSMIYFGLGGERERENLEIEVKGTDPEWDRKIYWKGTELKGTIFPLLGKTHTIAFSEKGGTLKAFIDGVMVVNEAVETPGIRGSVKGGRFDGFYVEFKYIDPTAGNEFLITDVKLSAYK